MGQLRLEHVPSGVAEDLAGIIKDEIANVLKDEEKAIEAAGTLVGQCKQRA